MRTFENKATVDTPSMLYSNVAVELLSDDDVTLEAVIRNRQGVVLEILRGPWQFENDAWLVDTEAGQAVIVRQDGCGCGGSSATTKLSVEAAQAAGNGYLP